MTLSLTYVLLPSAQVLCTESPIFWPRMYLSDMKVSRTKATKQATLTGSEHRRALPFLPFAVVAAIGSVTRRTTGLSRGPWVSWWP